MQSVLCRKQMGFLHELNHASQENEKREGEERVRKEEERTISEADKNSGVR